MNHSIMLEKEQSQTVRISIGFRCSAMLCLHLMVLSFGNSSIVASVESEILVTL